MFHVNGMAVGRQPAIENNGQLVVLAGRKIQVSRTVSMTIAVPGGSVDFAPFWTTAAAFALGVVNLRLLRAYAVVTVAPVPSTTGSGTAVLLGRGAAGSSEFINANAGLTLPAPVLGAMYGLPVAQRGADLVIANDWEASYAAAFSQTLRITAPGGTTFAGGELTVVQEYLATNPL